MAGRSARMTLMPQKDMHRMAKKLAGMLARSAVSMATMASCEKVLVQRKNIQMKRKTVKPRMLTSSGVVFRKNRAG